MAQVPGTTPVWLNCAPLNVVVDRWHSSQAAVVRGWFTGLPKAVPPLWQVAQPVVIPVWLNVAPLNVVVDRWQLSQAVVVGT